MKTKILSYILFSILFIFTSCGGGTTNSGHSDIIDNPQFEKSVLDSITVKTLPTKTQYSVGETLDPTGLVLQGNYIDYFSDGSTQTSKRDIDYNTYKNELAFSPTNLSTEGTIKITVTYNKKSTTFNITVGKSSSDSEYADWFKEVKIGGEDSPYKVYYVDDAQYNEGNDFTAEEKVNDYLDEYIKHIKSLTLNKNLTDNIEIDFDKIKDYPKEQRLDLLLGTAGDDTGLIYSEVNGINDICAPAIREIAKNVADTNKEFDLDYFYLNYRAIENEVYGVAYNKNNETYLNKKTEIENDLKNNNDHYKVNYSIYQTDGTIHPDAVQYFNDAIKTAATKLKTQYPQIENMETIVYNFVNLSFTASAIEGTHDQLSESLLVNEHKHTDECCNNEMVDTIYGVEYEEMTEPLNPIAKSKLNKSIFSQDFGRELC